MTYDSILTESVKMEFETFKKEQVSNPSEVIFNNAGIIHFYNEIYTYITENNLNPILGWRKIKKLVSHNEIIRLLYDEYLSKEYLSITNWDAIQEIIESFLN